MSRAFLRCGYAVIFLYRKQSLRPFYRHITNVDIFDYITNFDDDTITSEFLFIFWCIFKNKFVAVDAAAEMWKPFLEAISLYGLVQRSKTLLLVSYDTLFDYAHLLRGIARLLQLAHSLSLSLSLSVSVSVSLSLSLSLTHTHTHTHTHTC